jgi:hypothetical protein
MASSGILRRVTLIRTDVSEELSAYIFVNFISIIVLNFFQSDQLLGSARTLVFSVSTIDSLHVLHFLRSDLNWSMILLSEALLQLQNKT